MTVVIFMTSQGLVAGFFDALDVLPPVVDGDDDGEDGGGEVHVATASAWPCVPASAAGSQWCCAPTISSSFEQADDVLTGGHAGDRAGEDVVEHQGGDAELGEGAAEGLLDDAVDAAAGEHGTALDVDGAHREGEEHDAEDEPGGGLAD